MMIALFALALLAPSAQADAAALAKVRRALDDQLFDYPSARFREVYFTPTPSGDVLVCGEVNAKNRMGAFIGWKGFYWLGGSVTLADDDPTSVASVTYPIFCSAERRQGVDRAAEVTSKR